MNNFANLKSDNAYVLFGFEAIQARPNLDPYTSTLRTNDETMQVFTSDVHLKHHVRRGIKASAVANNIQKAGSAIFYEKQDEFGNPRDFNTRLKLIRETYNINTQQQDKKDALNYCLDLPLFGYVHAVKGESFNVVNAVNTLFRPTTFHACEIFSLGRNNAFPTLDKKGEIQDAAGSATVDSLEYGFFLALWEINLNMLRINAEHHKLINWQKDGAGKWIEIFIDGMWRAYTSDRYPSFTQRSQFAQFAIGWSPEGNVSYENPACLIDKLDHKKITSHSEAIVALNKILPEFLKGWNYTQSTMFFSQKADNCNLDFLR